jgi:hypothetical protein
MSSCPVCGLEEPGGRFCRGCGASLTFGADGAADYRYAYESENAERARRRLVVAIGTGVLVLTLGLGAWWFVSRFDAGATPESELASNLVPPNDEPSNPSPNVRPQPDAPVPDTTLLISPRPDGVLPEPATLQVVPRPAPPSPPRPAPKRLETNASDEIPLPRPQAIVEPVEHQAVSEPPALPVAALEPPPLVLPPGLRFAVRLRGVLSSKTAQVEDRFEAATVSDVALDRGAVIPSGSVVRGVVTAVAPGTRTNRTARISVEFDLITVAGRSYPIRGITDEIVGRGLKADAKRVGVGAGIGAVIGGLLGGVKGVATGAAIGGGGTLAATEGKDVELDDGAVLSVELAP